MRVVGPHRKLGGWEGQDNSAPFESLNLVVDNSTYKSSHEELEE
jgi:hypothetical protein